jgi:hypothetical protein
MLLAWIGHQDFVEERPVLQKLMANQSHEQMLSFNRHRVIIRKMPPALLALEIGRRSTFNVQTFTDDRLRR